jgi:hypothetical protein
MRAFDWHPGTEPLSLGAWGAVVLYLFSAYFCWRVARELRPIGVAARSEVLVCGTIATLFLVLGIFRELDFQPIVIGFGREMAQHQGWYGDRRVIQPVIIGVIGIAFLIAAIVLMKLAWGLPLITRLAVVGTLMLLTYIAVRMVSLHHVDVVAHQRLLGLRLSWIVEIGGMGAVILAAHVRRARIIAGS